MNPLKTPLFWDFFRPCPYGFSQTFCSGSSTTGELQRTRLWHGSDDPIPAHRDDLLEQQDASQLQLHSPTQK
jgi:hypothetical protein